MTIVQLHELFTAHSLISTDTRKIAEGSIFFALKGENFDGNRFAKDALDKGAAYAVIDEVKFKTSDRYILVDNVLQTLQELATYHRLQSKAKIVSLTGSNGKTTTKELIHAVLSQDYKTIATQGNLNNHIGVPLTLLSIQKDTEIAIIEMGANHQKEIAFLCTIAQPDFGYITNFGKAHLEGFGSIEGVIKGKCELYDYLQANQKSIFLNADDSIQQNKLGAYIKKFGFSTDNRQYYQIKLESANPFVQLKADDISIKSKLLGNYNFTNAAAAILIGKYFNVPFNKIKRAIENYVPDNNRSELIKKNGHTIILDAYNANPTSMKAALENFSSMDASYKIAFLGDMFELGKTAVEEHQLIADLSSKMQFDQVYLIGANFSKTSSKKKSFETFEALSAHLKDHPINKKGTILIKGSRGMAMERLLNNL